MYHLLENKEVYSQVITNHHDDFAEYLNERLYYNNVLYLLKRHLLCTVCVDVIEHLSTFWKVRNRSNGEHGPDRVNSP